MIEETIRRLPSNALHNLAALLLPVAASIAATPFIIHRLGEERFGLYMLVLSVVGLGALVDLGLSTASIKFIAESRASGDSVQLSNTINSLITSRLPSALMVVGVGYVAAPFICTQVLLVSPTLVPEAVLAMRIATTTVAVTLIGGALTALPRAAHRYDLVSRASLVFSLALTGATVSLVWAGFGLPHILAAELLVACLSLVVSGVLAHRTIPEWRYRPSLDLHSLRRLLVFGGYVTVGTLTGFLFAHANRILVGRTFGIAAVTFYAVPWNVSARIAQLVYALTEVIAPLASALAARDELATLRSLYRRTFRIIAVVVATAVVPLSVGAADLLWIWLGPTFAEHASVTLRILVLAAGIQSLGAVPYMMLNGIGLPARGMIPTVVGAVVNIVLAWLWGSELGVPGIALAVACGFVVQTVLLTRALDRSACMPHSSLRNLVHPLLTAVAAAAVGSASMTLVSDPWHRLVMGCIVGMVALHGLLLGSGWYEPREVTFIWESLTSRAPSVGDRGASAEAPKEP